jgi:protein O-GlcNAc transferase
VALDTFHYGGGANTIYDAFEAGVPVVTMPGEMHKGRYAFAAYQQIGVSQCIAKNPEEYSDLAVRIANDPEFRNSIVLQLKSNQQNIFEDEKSVYELEVFLKTVFAGLK